MSVVALIIIIIPNHFTTFDSPVHTCPGASNLSSFCAINTFTAPDKPVLFDKSNQLLVEIDEKC